MYLNEEEEEVRAGSPKVVQLVNRDLEIDARPSVTDIFYDSKDKILKTIIS